jgi:hypothetical protein
MIIRPPQLLFADGPRLGLGAAECERTVLGPLSTGVEAAQGLAIGQ